MPALPCQHCPVVERDAKEHQRSPWAVALPTQLGAGKDIMGAFLPREVPLRRWHFRGHAPLPALPEVGAAGEGCSQGWVLLGMGADSNGCFQGQGAQSQLEDSVLLWHHLLATAGTVAHQHLAQETSCACTSPRSSRSLCSHTILVAFL